MGKNSLGLLAKKYTHQSLGMEMEIKPCENTKHLDQAELCPCK